MSYDAAAAVFSGSPGGDVPASFAGRMRIPAYTASMRIFVLNGPNLNTLGTRKPEVYGTETLADVDGRCARRAAEHGATVECFQTNHEGELVELIHRARTEADGIVINAGAYTHTSVAIHDALEYAQTPTVEVHISNVHRREAFRHHSYISPQATAVIAGAGTLGYELAIEFLVDQRQAHSKPETHSSGLPFERIKDLRDITFEDPSHSA